ncbi:sigma-70 family RNA polymerase sigma factor [Streptomyces shenzhenensis]|uniref:sigma-70 family RNA polymerase sigma factor n=1 Tax=Streptomyces shenzhenensis TaxID=943815 RepID=UPI001F3C713E|nr:sigma-70 family RNA polymerase sigma factor [Streptomyces shenzhenensis]
MRALLMRYADADGYVTSQTLDGVIRLAGLTAREADELRSGARVRDAETGAEEPNTAEVVTSPPEGEPEAAEGEPGTAESGPGAAEQEVLPETGEFADAVAAAMSVLRVDRVQPRPDSRLLSAEAEVGLAVLVRGGADRVAQEPEEAELCALPPGDLRIRARDCLVLHNQRLVHALVRSYLEQGLDYEDLFQVGVLGLMRAARKFDPTMGNKFSTYATWWVRQQIGRAIADEGALIRVPVHMHEQMRKVAAAERTLAAQGRPAGVVDVAVLCDLSVQKVAEIRKLSRRTDSLDRVIGDGTTLGDFVGERQALPSVEQGVVTALLMEDVMAVVDTFPERDARILVRRLSLDGDEPSTLDELGREFGVTRERIRQVESKALPVFRERLRKAGITSAHEGGGSPDATEGRKQARPASRLTHGRAVPVASVDRTSSRADDDPAQADGPAQAHRPAHRNHEEAHRNDEEAAAAVEDVVEENKGDAGKDRLDGVVEPPPPTAAAQAAERAGLDEADEPESPGERGPAESGQRTADWERALRMGAKFEGGIDWLAEYALLALGQDRLALVLGPRATADVVRAARERRMPDRQVLAALEVLQRVFDTLRRARLRPEDFFERPCEALVGLTPSAYLARKPLVNSESRLAVRDALRELVAGLQSRQEPEQPPPASDAHPGGESAGASDREPVVPEEASSSDGRSLPPGQADGRGQVETVSHHVACPDEPAASHHVPGHDEVLDDAGGSPAEDTGLPSEDQGEAAPSVAVQEEEQGSTGDARIVAGLRRDHEAELERVRLEHQEHLAQERRARQAADDRAAAAEAETARQLDTLDETLLRRVDTALLRQERHLRGQAEERLARLREEHHEAQRATAEQAERLEQQLILATRHTSRDDQQAAMSRLRASQAEQRAAEADQRAVEADRRGALAEQRATEAEQHATLAEQRLTEAEQRAARAEQRGFEGDRRLRRYREEAEARLEELEERLSLVEADLDQRDRALAAARRETALQVDAAEQRAAQRIAQAEHDALTRIAELQEQLAEREAAAGRGSFRDRWRRS